MENIKEYEAIVKIALTEGERTQVQAAANMLVESFNELTKIDVDGVEPLVTVLDIQNVLREDISHKMLLREEILANAPEQYDGYFQVPKTLD